MKDSDAPWKMLRSGERIKISSRSGNVYEAVVLLCSEGDAGIYVRRNGRIGRLLPERLDWSTLERIGQTDPVVKGDYVIVSPTGGSEKRGKLLAPLDERLDIGLPSGGVFSAPLARLANSDFWLVFLAQDLRAGDEFIVNSLSGREIRGRCIEVHEGTVIAELAPEGGRVRVAMERLDMNTLSVLVPIPLETLGCSPAM